MVLTIVLIVSGALNLTLAESAGAYGGTIIADNTPPSGFELISPENNKTISQATPVLTWENSSDNEAGIDHYEVWLGDSNVENTPAGNTSYETSSLGPDNYTWYIVAVNGVEFENRSENVFNFTVEEEDTNPPEKPTGVKATVKNSSQINLDWDDNPENDLSHYNVYRDNTSGFSVDAETLVENVEVSEFSDLGLTEDTTYYYKITAVDDWENESDASSEENATTTSSVKMGDANEDKEVNIVDALQIARYDAGLIEEDEINMEAADVTDCGSGSVDIVDALQVARYDAGLIESFECG